tara:strand:+ start:81 stop:1025 length:945 start_codon:yes stop_codon:yes gene_type:complete
MTIPTEEQIKSSWIGSSKVKVSICCTTYNHEDYIEETLKGFLVQKTLFPFEVIVHDDASTDNTLSILQKFKKLYPGLINLIVQEENQYSKGKKIARDFVWSEANGDFIALCEGDDYWVCSEKLQRQFDALENHEEIDLCFHDHFNLDNSGRITPSLIHSNRMNHILEVKEILMADGRFMSTASLMVRTRSLLNMPEWFSSTPVSDFFIQVLCSLNGALYLPERMSVYRTFAPNSWTATFRSMSPSDLKNYYDLLDKSLEDLSGFLGASYSKEISYRRFMLCMSAIKNSLFGLKLVSLFSYLPRSMYYLIKYLRE